MVEWKKLGEIVKRNKGIPITASQMSELASFDGNVRVFAAGQTVADIDESLLPANCSYNKPSIIIKSRGYIDFEYYDKPFTHKNEMWSYSFDDRTLCKFIFYYLTIKTEGFRKKARANSVKLPQLCVADTDDFLIPIPSLSEQTRIVGILDTFTASIENLKQQIAQRRKQYEHYRDQLLDLEGKDGVEMKTLGEVCDIKGRIGFRGYTRKDQVEKGKGAISLSPGNIVDGNMNYDSCTYITWAKYEESPEIMIDEGDVILCKTASVGKVARIDKLPEKATINPQLVVLKKLRIDSKYLNYTLQKHSIQAMLKALAGVGSVPNISQAKLGNLIIPVPSLPEQQRIVSILDTFEASIANLEQQLAQRERQYEYYRNKLLTFE